MTAKYKSIFKFVFLSLLGILMFFVTIPIGTLTTIPVDHIVKAILKIPKFGVIYGLIIIVLGTVMPFITGSFKKSKVSMVFAILNILGLVFSLMTVFQIGPEIITQDSMGPFVFNVVVVPVVTIVPVGSIFLSFIVSYGLMESIGTVMEPVMKPIFRTPGRSAIDAVASFVGSYSLALLVTNRVYKENKYTFREAATVATGFSTVSATFMIIAANTLGLMDHWILYFWTCLLVTFIVSAITARIYPLAKLPAQPYQIDQPIYREENPKYAHMNIFQRAWNIGVDNAQKSLPVRENILSNLKDGIQLAINIGPAIMSVGVLSLILSKYTNVFDWFGMVFYPITKLLGVPDAMLAAKGAAITLADMYVPAIIAANSDMVTKFVIGVICISEVLFFSASIPCILATDIPISLKDIVIIWLERVVLSLILVIPIARLLF